MNIRMVAMRLPFFMRNKSIRKQSAFILTQNLMIQGEQKAQRIIVEQLVHTLTKIWQNMVKDILC